MMRRLVVALMVAAVIAAMGVIGPTTKAVGPVSNVLPASTAKAQEPGQPTCGPWQIAWYVSEGLWWYGWSWRWCYNPSLQDPWYVDWASWAWGGPAPNQTPGYKYSVPAGAGPS